MAQTVPLEYTALTRRYFRPIKTPYKAFFRYVRHIVTMPFRSRYGAVLIDRYVDSEVPAIWKRDLADRKVLIVGTGPSLDRVEAGFFDQFDTIIYINFALRCLRRTGNEYFFTTDNGPVREFLDTYEDDAFLTLGKERCIIAPVFLDQFQMMLPPGRELFTWLKPDGAEWRVQKLRLGPLRLPLFLRYHPRQPDWDNFKIPPPGRVLPAVDHTSALSAVLFAASQGSRDISLIGCDFSAGRAAGAKSSQDVPDARTFSGARQAFEHMVRPLNAQGVSVTNLSWQV